MDKREEASCRSTWQLHWRFSGCVSFCVKSCSGVWLFNSVWHVAQFHLRDPFCHLPLPWTWHHPLRGETCGATWCAAGLGLEVPFENYVWLWVIHIEQGIQHNKPLNYIHLSSDWQLPTPCTAAWRQNTKKWWQPSNIHQAVGPCGVVQNLCYNSSVLVPLTSTKIPKTFMTHMCCFRHGMLQSSADNAWTAKAAYRLHEGVRVLFLLLMEVRTHVACLCASLMI